MPRHSQYLRCANSVESDMHDRLRMAQQHVAYDLVDIVNMVRPRPKTERELAIEELEADCGPTPNVWEWTV